MDRNQIPEATLDKAAPTPPMKLIEQRIYQAIGQASMCWDKPEYAGVFNTEEASKVANELFEDVVRLVERMR